MRQNFSIINYFKAKPHILVLLLSVAYALKWGAWFGSYDFSIPIPVDESGFQIGRDFAAFWVASKMLHEGQISQLYSDANFQEALAQYFPNSNPLKWGYPPTYLFVIYPLAYFGYVQGLLIYSVLFMAVFAIIICKKDGLNKLGLILAVASTPFLACLFLGQNGILFAAVIFGVFYYQPRHKIICAVLCAILAVSKPQLGILIPLFFLAKKDWQAIFYTSVFIFIAIGLSVLCFGAEVWQVYFNKALPEYSAAMIGKGFTIPSFYSALKFAIGQNMFFWGVYAIIAVYAAYSAFVVWKKQNSLELNLAMYAVSLLLVTPYYLVYDMMILTLAVALIWQNRAVSTKVLKMGLVVWTLPYASTVLDAMNYEMFFAILYAAYFLICSVLFIQVIKKEVTKTSLHY